MDETLNKYEEDIKKAEKRKCIEVSRCTDFRDGFRKDYLGTYKSKLKEAKKKIKNKNHAVKIEEKPSEEIF